MKYLGVTSDSSIVTIAMEEIQGMVWDTAQSTLFVYLKGREASVALKFGPAEGRKTAEQLIDAWKNQVMPGQTLAQQISDALKPETPEMAAQRSPWKEPS